MLEALPDDVHPGAGGDAPVLPDAPSGAGDRQPQPRVVRAVAGGEQHGADPLGAQVQPPRRVRHPDRFRPAPRGVGPSDRPEPIRVPEPPQRLDLRAEGIGTVLLATGYRPHYPWLQVPVPAADGRIQQRRGVTPAPGLYVVGQRFQHRRDSASIDGARHDARDGRGPPARRSDGRRAGRAERGAGGMTDYDVVVVGGRVAGASTALLLARAGAPGRAGRAGGRTAATPSRRTR